MKIYVAGPYTGETVDDIEENVRKALDAGIKIIQLGHCPFIPHLTHFVELHAKQKGITISYDEYIKMDLEWLSSCDGLLLLGFSPGARKEWRKSKDLGLKVYYKVEEIEKETASKE